MSYNILADLYIKQYMKKSKKESFFPYCDLQYQAAEYRYPLLMAELIGEKLFKLAEEVSKTPAAYNADILSLQEVDYRFYYRYLSTFLRQHGYSLIMRLKVT